MANPHLKSAFSPYSESPSSPRAFPSSTAFGMAQRYVAILLALLPLSFVVGQPD